MIDIEKLRKAKKVKRLTFDEIAEQAGVGVSTVYDLFRGETTAPRVDTLERIETVLGLRGECSDAGSSSVPSLLPLSKDEAELVTLYRTAPEAAKDAIPLTAPKNGKRSPFFHAFSGFRGVFLKVCPQSAPTIFYQKLSLSSVFPLPRRAEFFCKKVKIFSEKRLTNAFVYGRIYL